jgi:hypothetical protein
MPEAHVKLSRPENGTYFKLAVVIEPVLAAWRAVRDQVAGGLYPAPETAFKERKVSKRMNHTRVRDDDPTNSEDLEL